MSKQPLQAAFEDKLMSADECIAALGWTCANSVKHEDGTGPITCSCGTQVKTGGWFGTEQAWCPECKKGMQDMTGLLPASQATAGYVDCDKFEMPTDGKHWIPKNVWGLSQ